MRAAACWVADHELWVLAVLLPGLILPNPLSPWAVMALPLLWLLRWAARGAITRRTSLDGPILLLLLLLPLGLWASPDPALSLRALYLPLGGVALYFGLVNWIAPVYGGADFLPPVGEPLASLPPGCARGRREAAHGLGEETAPARIARAAGLLVAGGAGLALVSPLLVPSWGKVGINQPLLPEAFAILGPYLPDTIQTNTLGAVMAMLLCPTVAWLLAAERGQPAFPRRFLRAGGLAVALALMSVILVLAWSRGALAALVPALLLVLVLTDWRWAGVVPPLALLGVGLVGWLGPQRILDQLLSSGPAYHGVAATRLEIWDRALRLLADVPYTGLGLGMFGRVVPARYAYVLNASFEPPQVHAHNIFLQAGSDLGLLGVVVLAWLLLAAFVSLARTLRARPGGWQRPIAVGLLGALIVFTLHGQVNCSVWTLKPEVVFWTLLGLVGGLEVANPRLSLWSLAARHRRLAGAVAGLLALALLALALVALPAGISLGYANRGNRAFNQAILAATPPSAAAIADLQQAVAWWGDNQAARLALGLAYDRAGQSSAALDTWRAIPRSAAAWLVIEGDSRFVSQRYEEAQDRYLLAAALDPGSGSAQFGLAEVYRVWGARQQALAAYEQAKKLANFQPGGRADLAACYFGSGKVYAQAEDWPAAVWQLKAGLDLRPDEDAYRTLGDVYHRGLKDLAQAEACFRQAIALRPDRPHAYEQLGRVYLDGKRPGDARTQFEMAVALAPDDAAAHAGLAQAYAALGLPDQAIREYTVATQLSPNDAWLFIRLGDAYRDLGRIAEARAAYEQALAVDPGNQWAKRRIEALP